MSYKAAFVDVGHKEAVETSLDQSESYRNYMILQHATRCCSLALVKQAEFTDSV